MYLLQATLDRISTNMIIIGLLTIVILGSLIYFLIYKKMLKKAPTDTLKADFVTDVPDLTAANGIYNYRSLTSLTAIKDCVGALYTKDEILNYFAQGGPYDSIIQRQAQMGSKPMPDGYEWRVGFYWFVRDVGGKKQLGYYVIPTAYNPTTEDVLNYFTDSFYYHPGSGGFASIKDEGHLWP